MSTLTWAELAVILNISARTLERWRNKYLDAPRTPEESAWTEWMERRKLSDQLTAGVSGVGLPGECAYDQAVAEGKIDYQQAKIREQVIAESIGNRIKTQDLAKAAGDLVTSADAKKACAEVRDRMERRFTRTVNHLTAALSGTLSLEQRGRVTSDLEKAWDKAASEE